MPIFTINDRLEKSNRLLLLKDTKRGEYSDRTTTDDSELYPNYCARFPFQNDYLKSNRMELGYSNIKVGETFPYTPIPIMFRTTAYYRLKIEKDVLKFKCLTYKGCKGISGSAGMYWFRLPIKYKDASKVSFIRVSEWSNAFNERKFVGHYVIKTID